MNKTRSTYCINNLYVGSLALHLLHNYITYSYLFKLISSLCTSDPFHCSLQPYQWKEVALLRCYHAGHQKQVFSASCCNLRVETGWCISCRLSLKLANRSTMMILLVKPDFLTNISRWLNVNTSIQMYLKESRTKNPVLEFALDKELIKKVLLKYLNVELYE